MLLVTIALRKNAAAFWQFRFEYVSGAMECTFFEPDAPSLLKKFGIREHICEVLEGGQLAFEERERKYAFKR